MWELLAESRIQEALKNGEFDGLPGQGEPIDLEAYFALPPGFRMGYSILKNAGEVPPEVENLKLIARLEEQLEDSTDPEQRRRLLERIEAERVTFQIRMERRRSDR